MRQAPSGISTIVTAVDRVSYGLNAAAEFLLWVLVALTIIATFVQVIFRYGLESSLSWSEELSRYLFVWIILVGASVATRRRQHIFVEVLVARLRPALRAWTDLLSVIASMIFFSTFAYVGSLLMLNAWQQYSTALDIRIAWVYAAAPVGAGLSVLHLLAGLLKRLSGEEPARAVQSAAEGLE